MTLVCNKPQKSLSKAYTPLANAARKPHRWRTMLLLSQVCIDRRPRRFVPRSGGRCGRVPSGAGGCWQAPSGAASEQAGRQRPRARSGVSAGRPARLRRPSAACCRTEPPLSRRLCRSTCRCKHGTRRVPRKLAKDADRLGLDVTFLDHWVLHSLMYDDESIL